MNHFIIIYFQILSWVIATLGVSLNCGVCDAVQLFPTSLDVTARRHPCANEQMMLICEVNGTRLDVRLDSIYRARYFDTNRVDDVRTVSGPNIRLRTILTGNEATAQSIMTESIALRRLTATIIVEVTESSTGLHDIVCSSNTDSQVFTFQIADKPNEPRNVVQNSDNHLLTSLQWDAPDNIDRFDLEHFQIQLVSLSEAAEEYVLNVTSTEVGYPFGLSSSILIHDLNLTVSAVNKCSQQGPTSTPVIIPKNVHITETENSGLEQHSSNLKLTTVDSGSKDLHVSLNKVTVGSLTLVMLLFQ